MATSHETTLQISGHQIDDAVLHQTCLDDSVVGAGDAAFFSGIAMRSSGYPGARPSAPRDQTRRSAAGRPPGAACMITPIPA